MFNPALQKNITAIQAINDSISEIAIKKILDDFRINLVLDTQLYDNPNAVETTNVLLNILPRLFTEVRYNGDLKILNQFPPSHKKLINIGENDWKSSLIIKIGDQVENTEIPVLYVGCCGWSSYLSFSNPCPYSSDSQNPFGAILAGALAMGEAFKMAFSSYLNVKLCDELIYDTLTHGTGKAPVEKPIIPNEIHFDNLTLIGLGSVGMGLVYILSKLPQLTGRSVLIDHEVTDESNEQRYFLSFQENRSARKIDIVAQTLKQKYPILEILAIGNRYEEYMHIHSDCLNYMPLIVSTVDTDTTRKNIQANLPKKIINGWTETEGSILSYGVGVHEFLNEYECLNCVYFPKTAPSDQIEFYSIRTGLTVEDVKKRLKEKIPTTDKDIEFISKKKGVPIDSLMQFIGKPLDELIHGQCGLFSIPIQGKPATASVPHIPLLVALHLATQLLIPNLERTPEIKPIESAAVFNGLGIPNIKNLELRKKEPRCICSDLIYQEAYKEKWGI